MPSKPGPMFLSWVIVALHCALIVVGLAEDEVLTAVATGSLLLFGSAWFALQKGRALSFMLPLVFVLINIVTFAYMNLLYLRFTNEPTGIHHDLTAWLATLMSGCAMLGAMTVHLIIGRERVPAVAPPIVLRSETMVVASLVFGAMAAGQVSTGWFNARWERTGSDFGAIYLVEGLGPIGFMFFLVLGTRIRGPLSLPRNLFLLGLSASIALLQGLSGSRGSSVYMVLLTLGGIAWSGAGRRRLWLATAVCAIGVAFFSLIVQEARGKQGFGYGSANARANIMLQTAQEVRQGAGDEQPLFQPLIARMFEFSAQVVIDQMVLTQRFVGFKDFERLQYLFVPRVFAPEKRVLSEGRETLIREFGFVIGEMTGVPITLIADAYRRGGLPWVLAVGFLVGAALRLVTRLTVLVIGADLALIPLALFAILVHGLPPESVLGSISVLVYHWSKQTFMFFGVALLIRALVALNVARAGQRAAERVPSRIR